MEDRRTIAMIIDSIAYLEDYKAVLPYLEEGLAAVKKNGTDQIGKFPFEHGFYMIQEGKTKPLSEGDFESHQKYIDLQIILEGSEEVAWHDVRDLKVTIPYDEAGDKQKLSGDREHHMLISKGMFWAAFPWDGHRPVCHTDEPHTYRKIVMKLPYQKAF